MKNRFFGILLILILPIVSFGQNLDSLYAIIEGDEADTVRIKTMLQTSQLLQSTDEAEAVYLANSASILAVQTKEYKLAAQSFNQLGLLAYFKGQIKDCKAYFEEAMTYYELAEIPLGIASAGNNIGVIEYEQGFFYNALNYFAESLVIRKANNDSASISVSYNNIGNVYKDLKQLHKANEFYQKSIELKLLLNDDYGLAMTYNNQGQVYHELGNYDKAIELYNSSIDLKTVLNDEHGLAMTLANLGNSQKELGLFKLAQENIEKSAELRLKIGDEFGILHSNLILAQLFVAQEKYSEAEGLFMQSMKDSKEMEALVQLRDSYFGLFVCYEDQSNYEQALFYHKLYATLSDSLNNAENLKVADQVGAQIEIADKDEQIQKLTQKVESSVPFWKERWFELLAFLLLIAAVLFLAFISVKNKQESKSDDSYSLKKINSLRIVFLTAAIMTPVIGYFRHVEGEFLFEPAWLRSLVGLFIVAPIVASYTFDWVRKNLVLISVVYFYGVTMLLIFFMYKNNTSAPYFIDVLVISAASSVIFKRLKEFSYYILFFILSLTISYFLLENPELKGSIYFSIVFTSCGVVFMTMMAKANAISQVSLSNEIVNEVEALVFIANEKGKTIYSSNSVSKILGYKSSEVIQGNWYETAGFSKEEVEQIELNLGAIARGEKKPVVNDFQPFKTKTGETRWIIWKDKRIKGNRVLGIGQDGTENKRILDELKDSERKFRLINETLEDVFYLYNVTEKKYDYISPDCAEILGADQEFFYSGKSHRKFFVLKEDLDIVKEANIKVENGQSYEIEFRIKINDEIKWIREKSVPIFNDKNEIIKNSGVCQDITDVKRNQEELTKLSLVASTTTNYVIIAHIENGIEWVNEAFEKKFGYSSEEVIGKFPSEVIHTRKSNVIDIIDNVVFKQGEKFSGEIIHTTKAGKNVYAKVDVIPLKNRQGEVEKYFVLGVDLTDNKEQERAIAESHQELKKKEAELNKSELNFRHLIGSIKQVFWLSDFETKELLFVSESYENVFGYPGELLKHDPKSWSDPIHPDDKEMAIREFSEKGALGKFDIVYRIIVKDKIKWVHSRTYQVLDDSEKTVMLSGITEDITQKKLQELQLENLNKRLAVIHEIENTILTSESSSEIIYNTLNKTLEELPILRSSLALFNYNQGSFYSYTSTHDNESSLTDKRVFSLDDFSVLEELQTTHKHIITNITEKKVKSKTDEILIEEGVTLTLMSPLIHGNELIGSFNVCFRSGIENPDELEDYIDVTNEIANGLAIAIQQSKLKEEIVVKNKDITSSINYAKMIQDAHIPQDLNHEGMLPNHCLFFRPKDIVSGDFYWTEKVGDDLVIVIGDCTGHGVPGAFMTIIGINLLSKIVTHQQIIDPGSILTELNLEIKKSLSTKREIQIEDGMDVGVCVFNQKTRALKFAGAKRPLVHMCDGEIKIIDANKYSIGSTYENATFSTQTITCGSRNRFYIFSDGFPDQFGGPDLRKYNRKKVYQLIENIADLDFKDQELAVNKSFDDWQGSNSQTDDVVFAGFEF